MPEGSRRRHIQPVDEIPQSLYSARQLIRPSRQPLIPQLQPYFPNTTTTLQIFADGACRGNGSNNTKSSFGIWSTAYECPYNAHFIIDVPTNNRAELTSAIHACMTITNIASIHPFITQFTIKMDSSYVISGVVEARTTLPYDSSHSNSDLWFLLGEKIKLLPPSIHVNWTWIPRHQNKEADELANCILDNRPPNTAITSTTLSISLTDDLLHRTLEKITSQRISCMKHISPKLDILFLAIISTITNRNHYTHQQRRILFILLPHLISTSRTHISNTTEFKHFRTHLSMLTDESYLIHTLQEINNTPLQFRDTPTAPNRQRLMALCRVGAFHKCIPSTTCTIDCHPPASVINKLQSEAFPEKDLPPPLPVTPVTCTFGEILRAFKKLKSHKAAPLSGWTKELLYVVLKHGQHLTTFIEQIFNDFINTNISPAESALLKTSLSVILQYTGTEKRRLISISDTLLKLAFHIVFTDTLQKDQQLHKSGHTIGLSGQCQIAVAAIQQAVNNNVQVMRYDAVSAHPTISRHAAFAYFKKYSHLYHNTFPLINLLYSSKSFSTVFANDGHPLYRFTSTAGTFQGCVSANPFYTCATITTTLSLHPNIVQVADDIHTLRDFDPTTVTNAFAQIDQKLDGPKCFILTRSTLPAKILGAIITHPLNTEAEINKALTPYLVKLRNTYNTLLTLDCSLQCKTLILRSITWNWMYFMETFSNRAGEIFAIAIDDAQFTTFTSLFPSVPHTCYGRIFMPVEAGGMGLIPYTDLQPFLKQRSILKAIPHVSSKFNLQIDLPLPSNPQTSSLKIAWMTLFKEHCLATRTSNVSLHDRMYLKNSDFTSWLVTWPRNKWSELSDAEITTAINLRYTCIPSRDIYCDNHSLLSLSPELFTRHITSCPRCSAYHNIPRHEAVVHMLHRTFTWHNTHSKVLTRGELPLDHSAPKSGSDLLITTNDRFHLDVKIVSESLPYQSSSRIKLRFKDTMNWYQDFQRSTNIKTVPFILSLFGIISPSTLHLLPPLCHHAVDPSQLLRDICTNVQFELFRSMHHHLQTLYVAHRPSASNLSRIPNELERSSPIGTVTPRQADNTAEEGEEDAWLFTLGEAPTHGSQSASRRVPTPK